jgi:hypothetical protein
MTQQYVLPQAIHTVYNEPCREIKCLISYYCAFRSEFNVFTNLRQLQTRYNMSKPLKGTISRDFDPQ